VSHFIHPNIIQSLDKAPDDLSNNRQERVTTPSIKLPQRTAIIHSYESTQSIIWLTCSFNYKMRYKTGATWTSKIQSFYKFLENLYGNFQQEFGISYISTSSISPTSKQPRLSKCPQYDICSSPCNRPVILRSIQKLRMRRLPNATKVVKDKHTGSAKRPLN
jgi:hypothetical protein